MNKNNFIIQFGGLKDGVHYFVFEINKEFFDLIEYSELHNSSINLKVELIKNTTNLIFNFKFTGFVNLICDRCLDEFQHNIEFEEVLYIKFGEENQEIDADLIVMKQGNTQINLLEIIYQFIIVNLPIKKVHPNDKNANSTCNTDMLNRINGFDVENKSEQEEILDSRWNELKKLRNGTS